MNFERGKNVKESMGIGIIPQSREIGALYALYWAAAEDVKLTPHPFKKEPKKLQPDNVFPVLKKIEDGVLDVEDFAAALIPKPDDIQTGGLTILSDIKENYVLYRSVGHLAISQYDRPNEFNTREIIIKLPKNGIRER